MTMQDKINEIMGLVDEYCQKKNSMWSENPYVHQASFEDVSAAKSLIESKLRELDRIAELEKDAARWKSATRDLDINDVAVVVYDKYGDERVVTGDDADSAIDTAMQKD